MPLRHCPARIYKYFGPKVDVIESLIQGLLRYTPLGAFNDPFEGRPNLTGINGDPELVTQLERKLAEEDLDDDFKKILWDLSSEYYPQIPEEERRTVSLNEFRQYLCDTLKQNNEEIVYKVLNSPSMLMNILGQRIDKHVGACSFSEVPDSLLMWAHYGAWHNGFVVEFNAHHPYFHQQVSPEDELRHLRRVLYRSSRTSALLSELSGTEMFLVKSEHWVYEREWRILRAFENAARVIPQPTYPIHLFAFPLEAVTSVILGARIQPDTEGHVRRFLGAVFCGGNANLKRVVPDESDFVLRIKEDR